MWSVGKWVVRLLGLREGGFGLGCKGGGWWSGVGKDDCGWV